MQRVLVIGSPGSGKSTFATELARRTALPLIHLDQQFWNAGWVETPKAAWSAKLAELVAGDRWIIDGNYGGSLELRLARADTVIDLQFPPWVCIWRILRRVITSRGRVRSDMAAGCPEQFNFEFLLYTATFPFTARRRTLAKVSRFDGEIIRLRSSAEVRNFLQSVPNSETGS
ncbi:MAG TPA: topology modulation protein [Sphingomicrobium sp.]